MSVGRLLSLTALCFAALLLIHAPQLADPLIEWDDYPAYFGNEEAFYEKTLSEGRWINYWWIARPYLWPAPVNFLIYQLGWAVFAAAAALNALGNAGFRRTALLGLFIAVCPQAFLISGWFNTLMPGIWIVAIYSLLVLFLPFRLSLALYLLFAPLSMLAYSTYPFLMLALLLTRHDVDKSFGRLVGFVMLLGIGIAIGMGLMFGLNYLEHGIFGIELADWRRQQAEAATLAAMIENAEFILPGFALNLFHSMAFGSPVIGAVNLTLIALALLILFRRDRMEALYPLTACLVFAGLLLVIAIKEGAPVPLRSLAAVWMLFSVALFRAIDHLGEDRQRLGEVAFAVLLLLFAVQLFSTTAGYGPWSDATRAIAAATPEGETEVYVIGDASAVPGVENAHNFHPWALGPRLHMLTGARIHRCGETGVTQCNGIAIPTPGNSADFFRAAPTPQGMFIFLPG